ncbi:prevent-host-death protein [uncultured Nocardioides sp.]|uniref:type II toxin-antitoxin system Phd/YefM family antitoxin n=1 Tax=uncultured Nocardioides sp. TaxID=198441 RepID=UPI0026282289|nr:prevent-host-death protein [uncultured Nocardioides sp.]
MTESISQRELRNDNGRIMRALDEGRSFVISRNGQPIGELRPLRRDRLVDAGLVTAVFERAPRLDAGRLREDVDAFLDQGHEPRA